jgi:hypothetical protein
MGNDSGPDFLFGLLDAKDWAQLETALSGEADISEDALFNLADSLSQYSESLAAEDGLEQADEALSSLFLCHERAPQLAGIRDNLLDAALTVISEAGDCEDFARAERRTRELFGLLAKSGGRALSRACANALALNISNYLDCDPAGMKQANSHYAALKKLAGRHTDDPAMPAMQAWAKRCFLRETAFSGKTSRYESELRDLQAFSERHRDNALVAEQYAMACLICLKKYIGCSAPDRAEAMFCELERLTREYNESYRAWTEIEPDYAFPGYSSDNLDSWFLVGAGELAAKYAENRTVKPLSDCLNRVRTMPVYCDSLEERNLILGQIFSNLTYIYGLKDAEKAEECLAELRRLRRETPESAGALSDALYNLETEYAEADTVLHSGKIRALIDELEQIAKETDDIRTRTRYASALYNLYVNSPEDTPDYRAEDALYRYALNNIVETNVAVALARAEVELISLTGSRDELPSMRHFYERVKALARADAYAASEEMIAQSAAADFNVLVVAGSAGNRDMAQAMMDNLLLLAKENPENRGVILRLVKAALNMLVDYGEAGELAKSETVYRAFLPYALPFAGDAEIADRIVNAAHSYCVDLLNAGNPSRVREIYADVKDAKPGQAAAGRLAWIRQRASDRRSFI